MVSPSPRLAWRAARELRCCAARRCGRPRGHGIGAALLRRALDEAAARYRQAYLFSTDAGAFWSRQGFYEVPVAELVAALPNAPQVRHYDEQGWLPDEVAWRRDLAEEPSDDRRCGLQGIVHRLPSAACRPVN